MQLANDEGPEAKRFLMDVKRGLESQPRRLPSQYLYDALGSQLFDRICELEEYYLTRCELEILEKSGGEICQALGPACLLIEFGSGSSLKTRVLLDQLEEPCAYVPVDISRDHLQDSATALARQYDELEILPVCADYTRPFELPEPSVSAQRRVVYFSGSTIGNLSRDAAVELLAHQRALVSDRGGVLIGVDLHKDRQTLEAAYDDAQGVTAEFELNLLARMNRELHAGFDLEAWSYRARYDTDRRRIEMYVCSERDQSIDLAGTRFDFARGERVLTEISQKYTLSDFAELSKDAGLRVVRIWTDAKARFSVQYLEPA